MTVGSPAPAKHRLGAVTRGAFSHDTLNMHLYGVFRKLESDGNQFVGKAELQRLEHVLFARRKVGHRSFRRNRGGAAMLMDSAWLADVGVFRYRVGARCSVLPHDRQGPVDASGKYQAQSGDDDFDRNRYREKASDSPLHRG